MKYFPIFVNLKNKPVLVIGGGEIASRKVDILLQAKANVKIISNKLCTKLTSLVKEKKIELISNFFEEKHLINVFLVIAATNDEKINFYVSQISYQHMKLINVVDDESKCSFIVPSIIDRSPITIAISSGGKSPVLTKLIRERLESLIPNFIGYAAQIAGKFREKVKNKIKNIYHRRRFWELLFNNKLINESYACNPNIVKKIINQKLKNYKNKKMGEIFLVGAGPGHPDLLTLRGLQIIQLADVILYDNLINKDILNLARRDSKKIYVGKCSGNHTFSQKEINFMMINLAISQKIVVRLKGGDPFIFGRGGEELQAIKKAGIEYQVVPGITSAIGISAYTGIPLTHRKYSNSVLLMSASHKSSSENNINWPIFLNKKQTIVIYMVKEKIKHVKNMLILNNFPSNIPIALISHGTYPQQRILVGTIENMDVISQSLSKPLILIIGNVVKLHYELSWFNSYSDKNNIEYSLFNLN